MNYAERTESDRIATLERRFAQTRRLLVLPFLLLPAAFVLGAADPQKFEDLVCGSLVVKNNAGKTVAKLSSDGDIEIAGKLAVGKLSVGGQDLATQIAALQQKGAGAGQGPRLKIADFNVMIAPKGANKPGDLIALDDQILPNNVVKTGLVKGQNKITHLWWCFADHLSNAKLTEWGYITPTFDPNDPTEIKIGLSASPRAGRVQIRIVIAYE